MGRKARDGRDPRSHVGVAREATGGICTCQTSLAHRMSLRFSRRAMGDRRTYLIADLGIVAPNQSREPVSYRSIALGRGRRSSHSPLFMCTRKLSLGHPMLAIMYRRRSRTNGGVHLRTEVIRDEGEVESHLCRRDLLALRRVIREVSIAYWRNISHICGARLYPQFESSMYHVILYLLPPFTIHATCSLYTHYCIIMDTLS